jgi:hypothetical protein
MMKAVELVAACTAIQIWAATMTSSGGPAPSEQANEAMRSFVKQRERLISGKGLEPTALTSGTEAAT